MAKSISTLLLSLSLALPSFGQMFDYGDMAWFGVVATPATATFAPTDISGLVRWFDAQSITANDQDAIETWTDKTGTLNLVQGDPSARPLYEDSWSGFGNKPAIKFDGSNDALTNANLVDASKTMFVVAQRTNNAQKVLLATGAGGAFQVYSDTANLWTYWSPTTTFGASSQNPQNSGVIVIRFNSLDSADLRGNAGAWVNINPHDALDDDGTFYLGSGIGSQNMPVYVGEMLVYNSPLTDSQVNQIGAYLAGRWNFTWTNL